MPRLNSYLRLLRAPAIPTAVSNILMGYLLANHAWLPLLPLAIVVLASVAIYTAGMVLNDVADIEEDRQRRPERPLPRGEISWNAARRLGIGLLGLGLSLSVLAGWSLGPEAGAWRWRPGGVGAILTVLVLAYNFGLKRGWAGPAVLGACRVLNVLLGMSVAAPHEFARVAWGPLQWSIAACIGLYVGGVSMLARREAGGVERGPLLAALGVILAAGGALLLLPWRPLDPQWELAVQGRAGLISLLFAVIFAPVVVRSIMACAQRTTVQVRRAVTTGLLSLIFIDATLCFALAPRTPLFALAVSLLIVPSMWLGRRAAAT